MAKPKKSKMTTLTAAIPEIGYLRLAQIIGDNRTDPPIPALIPIGRSAWYAGIKTGKYPKPIHPTPRTSMWKVEDVIQLLDRLAMEEAA